MRVTSALRVLVKDLVTRRYQITARFGVVSPTRAESARSDSADATRLRFTAILPSAVLAFLAEYRAVHATSQESQA
jgi:hypothetical protein